MWAITSTLCCPSHGTGARARQVRAEISAHRARSAPLHDINSPSTGTRNIAVTALFVGREAGVGGMLTNKDVV